MNETKTNNPEIKENPSVEKTDSTKSEKVEIPKDTLRTILDRLESLEASNKNLLSEVQKKDADIDMLKQVADKGRLARFQDQNKGPLIRTARVAFWNDEPILGWQKVKDEVGFRDGRLIVNQMIRLFLDAVDPETKQLKTVDLDYLYWAQNTQSQPGEVVEKSETDTGTFWTIQLKDGRKVKLDIRFINAF